MQSREPMSVQRASSGRHSNACACQASSLKHGRSSPSKFLAASARAVRPSAASARPERFGTDASLCIEPALGSEEACTVSKQALRRSPRPITRGPAATGFSRRGGFGLLAGGATQRTMRAGRVPQSALPNPSIERTSPGKPGDASHLKR